MFTPGSFHSLLFDRSETHSKDKDFIPDSERNAPEKKNSTGGERWSMETRHCYCCVCCTDGTMNRHSLCYCTFNSIQRRRERNTQVRRQTTMNAKDICRNLKTALGHTGWTAQTQRIFARDTRASSPWQRSTLPCRPWRQISPSQLSACISSTGAPDTGTPRPPTKKPPSDLHLYF